MKTRSQTRSSSSWTHLPPEIRLIILALIADQKPPGWGCLASVCREWQYVLEKANFYKLNLRESLAGSCFKEFETIVISSPEKRGLVHHICLSVELPRYTSTCCSSVRTPSVNPSIVVNTRVRKLFSLLSAWEPAGYLALEINVYSPSDCEHWFKNIYLSSEDVENNGEEEDVVPDAWGPTKVPPHLHDPQHGWRYGQQVQVPPRSAMERLFRTIYPSSPHRLATLAKVKAVTCFIIRRQLRRSICPYSVGWMVKRLYGLEHISWELWAPHIASHKQAHDQRKYFPNTVKRLTVFEDACEFYDTLPKGRARRTNWHNPVEHSHGLGVVLASRSLNLQYLAISFMVSAEEIFRRCQPARTWRRLESLALTSSLLQEDGDNSKKIEQLLRLAGKLVRNMPKIHTFVLWNGGRGHACAFVYRIDRESASVTWRGTWHMELSPDVVKSWQLAASSKLPRSELQINYESVQGLIRSHGDAIYHLKLPCQVIEPASLWQIRREVLQ